MKIRSAFAPAMMACAGVLAITLLIRATRHLLRPGRTFKVAYLPCGRVNDQSWSQAGYEGVVAAKKELGVETSYSESVPPADIEAAARDYASRGYNLVLLHCATFMDAGLKVAKDFPEDLVHCDFCVLGSEQRHFHQPAAATRHFRCRRACRHGDQVQQAGGDPLVQYPGL